MLIVISTHAKKSDCGWTIKSDFSDGTQATAVFSKALAFARWLASRGVQKSEVLRTVRQSMCFNTRPRRRCELAAAAVLDALRHREDFESYEADLRAAKRTAREAYVRYRSYCDALDQLPTRAAEADYGHLDDLAQLGGELRDLKASDFYV